MEAPPALDDVEPVPKSLWRSVHEDPLRAPEHIALAAADRFAAPAERWAERMGHQQGPDELARIAIRQHVWLSRLEGGAAGLGGAFTVVPDLAALAWIQGRMVFFVAAAHGFDPRHPMRPAELLTLQHVYSTPAEARAGLDGAGKPMAYQLMESRIQREQQLVKKLIKLVGRKMAKRAMLRVVPIVSAPISAMQNSHATSALGQRAKTYYGGDPTALPAGGDAPALGDSAPPAAPS